MKTKFKKIISLCLAIAFALTLTALPVKSLSQTFADNFKGTEVTLTNGDFTSSEVATTVEEEGKNYHISIPDGYAKADSASYSENIIVTTETTSENEGTGYLRITSSETEKFGLKTTSTINFVANSYYQVTVKLKTENSAKASLYLNLDGNNFAKMENFESTSANTFDFYVETSKLSSASAVVELWLGSKTEGTTGAVEFYSIDIKTISVTTYFDALAVERTSANNYVNIVKENSETFVFDTNAPTTYGWSVKDDKANLSMTTTNENEEIYVYSNEYTYNTPVENEGNYTVVNDADYADKTIIYVDNNNAYFDAAKNFKLGTVETVYYFENNRIYKNNDQYYTTSNFTGEPVVGPDEIRYSININGSDVEFSIIESTEKYSANAIPAYKDSNGKYYLTRTSSKVTFKEENGSANSSILKLVNSDESETLTAVSPTLVFEQFGYYVVTLYAKATNETSKVAINLIATVKTGDHPTGIDKSTSNESVAPYTTTTDATNNWVCYKFIVKGSPIRSTEATLQFAVEANSTVYVDHIEACKIDYATISSQTTIFNLSTNENNVSMIASATVTNGYFTDVDEIELNNSSETQFPISPAENTWEKTGTLTGVAGIVPTNGLLANLNGTAIPASGNLNIFAIQATSTSTVGYKSQSITATADSFYKLSFGVFVVDSAFTGNVYSKLYTSSSTISNIDAITTTNGNWVTYTYYIKSGSEDTTLYFEFGVTDMTGTAFFRNVEFKEIEEEDFTAKIEKTVNDKTETITLAEQKANNYVVLDLTTESFTAHTYSYTNATEHLFGSYSFSTSSSTTGIVGILNTEDDLTGTAFEGLTNLNLPSNKTPFVLVLNNNSTDKISSATQIFGTDLSASSYYKISVWVKTTEVDGNGLTLTLTQNGLADGESSITITFEQVKTNGYSNTETNGYKEYVAYVLTGTTGVSDMVLNAKLEGKGSAFIGTVSYTDSTRVDYNKAKRANGLKDSADIKFFDLTTEKTATTTTTTKENKTNGWEIFFVVFSSLILVGTLGYVIVVMTIRKLPKHKKSIKAKTITNKDGEEQQKGGFI